MRILVCGGRDFNDERRFEDGMYKALGPGEWAKYPHTIIEGGAKGADSLARAFAKKSEWGLETYTADWSKYGVRAGPIRNVEMLEAKPDLVIAFPGGRGTAHMVKIAKEASVKVIEIETN